MICPNCKKEINSGRFCKFCGEKIINSQKDSKDSKDSNTEEGKLEEIKNDN